MKTRLLASAVMLVLCAAATGKPAPKELPLTAEGAALHNTYSAALSELQKQIGAKLPTINPLQQAAFLTAHEQEKGTVTSKPGTKNETRKGNDYGNVKATLASVEAVKPILSTLGPFLSSNALDPVLVKATILADATPRGLAEFAQQSPEHGKLIDSLLADSALMHEMLVAGGAKARRYGRSMEILRDIQSANPRAKDGLFRRIALALALELAAPELCRYEDIDPIKRYRFYEKSHLDKQLDSHFANHSTWLLRQVVNDPHTEEDMLWMREMLWNYRPDHITAPEGFRARYVSLTTSEFGHKKPEVDETSGATFFQQIIDKGGLCGPKGGFGRNLGRAFGVPVWGARLRSHTAMAYWTPKGWTTILGVAWHSGFWSADAEPKRARVFRLEAMAREHPGEFLKASRAQWIGSILGEEELDGMNSGTGGLWRALSLNHMRATVLTHHPATEPNKLSWDIDTYSKEDPDLPEKMTSAPSFTAAQRNITTAPDGTLTIPAVACASPSANTKKIVFMNGRDGRPQLHYKRYELPEPLTYEITVPIAGKYLLLAEVVTLNQSQFFNVTINGATTPVEMKMPYTIGAWGSSDPIEVTLVAGKNTLTFNRTVPDDFMKEGYRYAGPQFGGITLRTLTLRHGAR